MALRSDGLEGDDKQALDFIVTRLRPLFEIKRVILFGSRSRKTHGEESDYDVLVIANTDMPFTQRQGEALMAVRGRSFALDLLVYTPDEAETEAKMLGSAVYWAEKEGIEYSA